MAKLPDHPIEKMPGTLATLQPGERAAFPLNGFKIDAEHSLFAWLGAEVDGQDPVEYGEIWRDQEGAFHADLKCGRRKWKPQDLRMYQMAKTSFIVLITTIIGTEADG